jgi:hypothetical protein
MLPARWWSVGGAGAIIPAILLPGVCSGVVDGLVSHREWCQVPATSTAQEQAGAQHARLIPRATFTSRARLHAKRRSGAKRGASWSATRAVNPARDLQLVGPVSRANDAPSEARSELERETGVDVPSTNARVEFSYRLA